MKQKWTPKPKDSGEIMVGTADGREFDIGPLAKTISKIKNGMAIIARNPWDKYGLAEVVTAGHDLSKWEHEDMPTDVGNIVRPLISHGVYPMLSAAHLAMKLRMEAERHLISKPTQTLGIRLTGAAASTWQVSIQNPYQGSGVAYEMRNALWAITALEGPPLAAAVSVLAAGVGTLYLTSAIWAGHDYVAASRAGIVPGSAAVGGGGNLANLIVPQWSASIFAPDKRERKSTTFSPWNLQGAGGILGSIMRETGQVTLAFLNATGVTIDVAFHVHMKASLCGGLFKHEILHQMFVPFHRQLSAAHHLQNFPIGSFRSAWRNTPVMGLDDLDPQVEEVMGDADMLDELD